MNSKWREIWKPRLGRGWSGLCWINLLILIGVALVMRSHGDLMWQTALLTFGPRWLALVPLVPLAVGGLLWRRRALIPVALAAVVAVGPVMGWCVRWPGGAERLPPQGLALRVVSANIDSDTDLRKLFEFLEETDPDLVAFQEGPFTHEILQRLQEKFYLAGTNDTFIASRYRILDCRLAPHSQGRGHIPAALVEVATPAGPIEAVCVHLCTLRSGFMSMIRHKLRGRAELQHVLQEHNEESEIASKFASQISGPGLVLGDFNMSAESAVFRRDFADWNDAFTQRGTGFGYTFHTRWIGLRIDHILADRTHWTIRSCRVGPDLASQHRPVIADLWLHAEKSKVPSGVVERN
jgi:vancomycin resistance protein VanJ